MLRRQARFGRLRTRSPRILRPFLLGHLDLLCVRFFVVAAGGVLVEPSLRRERLRGERAVPVPSRFRSGLPNVPHVRLRADAPSSAGGWQM